MRSFGIESGKLGALGYVFLVVLLAVLLLMVRQEWNRPYTPRPGSSRAEQKVEQPPASATRVEPQKPKPDPYTMATAECLLSQPSGVSGDRRELMQADCMAGKGFHEVAAHTRCSVATARMGINDVGHPAFVSCMKLKGFPEYANLFPPGSQTLADIPEYAMANYKASICRRHPQGWSPVFGYCDEGQKRVEGKEEVASRPVPATPEAVRESPKAPEPEIDVSDFDIRPWLRPPDLLAICEQAVSHTTVPDAERDMARDACALRHGLTPEAKSTRAYAELVAKLDPNTDPETLMPREASRRYRALQAACAKAAGVGPDRYVTIYRCMAQSEELNPMDRAFYTLMAEREAQEVTR